MPESPELPTATTDPTKEETRVYVTEYSEKPPLMYPSEGCSEQGKNIPFKDENPMQTNPVAETSNESFHALPVEQEEPEVLSAPLEVIEILDSSDDDANSDVVILGEDSRDLTREIEMSPIPTGPPVSLPCVHQSPLFYDKVVQKGEQQTMPFGEFDEPPAKRLAAEEEGLDVAMEISRLDSLLDEPPKTAADLVRTRLLHWPQPQLPNYPARVMLGDGVEYPLGHVDAALALQPAENGIYVTPGGLGDSIPGDVYSVLFGVPEANESGGPLFEILEDDESAGQDQHPVVISSDSDDGTSGAMKAGMGASHRKVSYAPPFCVSSCCPVH